MLKNPRHLLARKNHRQGVLTRGARQGHRFRPFTFQRQFPEQLVGADRLRRSLARPLAFIKHVQEILPQHLLTDPLGSHLAVFRRHAHMPVIVIDRLLGASAQTQIVAVAI